MTDFNAKARARREEYRQADEKFENLACRAARAEAAAGLGKCKDCRHWRRGPGVSVPNVANHRWGVCHATTHIEFVGEQWRGDPGQSIVTTEGFGCILFWDGVQRIDRRETRG